MNRLFVSGKVFAVCQVFWVSLLTNMGVVQAGDIKGKVVIHRPPPANVTIVSRSIIQRYVTKRAHDPEADHERHETQPTVVIYIDGIKQVETRTNGKVAILDQKDKTFVPHVLPIMVGTTVRFLNSDEVYHNVFSYSAAKSFDLGRYARGKYRSVTFTEPGVVKVYCDIHSHMNAFILVLENPYFATTDEAGNFEITNVPAGTYTLKAWYGRWPEKSQTIEVRSSGVTEVIFHFP